jgi:hypothetical protein
MLFWHPETKYSVLCETVKYNNIIWCHNIVQNGNGKVTRPFVKGLYAGSMVCKRRKVEWLAIHDKIAESAKSLPVPVWLHVGGALFIYLHEMLYTLWAFKLLVKWLSRYFMSKFTSQNSPYKTLIIERSRRVISQALKSSSSLLVDAFGESQFLVYTSFGYIILCTAVGTGRATRKLTVFVQALSVMSDCALWRTVISS